MNNAPLTLGLFEKRIEGDDSLMQLARLRFQQAGMGAEMHAATPEQLDWTMRFRPAGDAPVVVHLSRGTNLAEAESRRQIENFARRYAGWIHGLVIHDHQKLADNFQDYVRAAQEMNSRLRQIKNCPRLFVEYAAGLELEAFVKFFEAIRTLDRISVCVDIGHVGIHAARKAYSQIHPGVDVCALKSRPALIPQAMPDIEKAVTAALPAVLGLVAQLGKFGKPAHFHLHDGHPLSTFSPFGVADHLSFLAEIPLDFDHRGQRRAELMFGPKGLSQIVAGTMRAFGRDPVSFTLEIHPQTNHLPLGDAAHLFNHWRDKTNAEKMNAWLAMLAENHQLLRGAIFAAPGGHCAVVKLATDFFEPL
jgi:hypothetical protein